MSVFTAAAKAAMTTVPKLFTSPWTMRIPKFITDCCRQVSEERLSISLSIAAGVHYLRIEGAFYIGIGFLFLLYGYFRAIKRAGMSVVLTVISLGVRVLLAYALSSISSIGVTGIWVAIPIGWFLADVTGLIYMKFLSSNAGTGV